MNSDTRAARAADIPGMGEVSEGIDLFPPDMLPDMIAPALTGGPDIWCVAEDGAVRGLAYCAPERMPDGTWNLLALGVAAEAQGRGIGRGLIAAVEAAVAAVGGRLLLIETLADPGFARQRRIYARYGFEEEARIRDFYGPGQTKVTFRKVVEGG
ncbi:MAG: GNAT family N-acetyltransferase [Shimia sp.]